MSASNDLARELEEMENQRDAVTLMLARVEQANEERLPWSMVKRLQKGDHPLLVWREYRQLSLDDLAHRAGVSPDLVRAIENASETAPLSVLQSIARVLEVDMELLVPWSRE